MTAPLRLLHASNLRLGSPLRFVRDTAGPRPGHRSAIPEPGIVNGEATDHGLDETGLNRFIEGATFFAWEQIIRLCLETAETGGESQTEFERSPNSSDQPAVDVLLLAGNTFLEADRSVPVRTALLSGLHRLARAGVYVVVACGPADPFSAWTRIPDLPPSVHVIPPGSGPRPVIELPGNARLHPVVHDPITDTWPDIETLPKNPDGPVIGFITEDQTDRVSEPNPCTLVLPLPISPTGESSAICHSPQPLHAGEAATGRVTCYEFHGSRLDGRDSISIGSVRRDRFEIDPGLHERPELMVEALWDQISEADTEPTFAADVPRLRIVTWETPATEFDPDWWSDAESRTVLLENLDALIDDEGTRLLHRVRRKIDIGLDDHFGSDPHTAILPFETDSDHDTRSTVASAYLTELQTTDPRVVRRIGLEVAAATGSSPPRETLPTDQLARILREAAAIGLGWLGEDGERIGA